MTGYDEAAREALRSRKRRWPHENPNYADGYTDACEAKEVQLANSGAVITRQSRILDRVAGALNGPPPDNAGWPHRDLPDTARAKAAELAELRADLDEYVQALNRSRQLLTGVANALNGPPPELTHWSHHDLPEKAAAAVSELAGLHRNLFELTDKQTARIKAVDAWLDERHGLHTDPEVVFEPEYRPGRGHDVTVYWLDGETAARADIDVYGNGSTAVWSLVLEHGGEDCTCIDCIDNEEN